MQAFQLIRGGQDRRLQTASLLAALPQLAGGKLLPARVAQELEAAYLFLRRLENRLQMLADQQTHTLPEDALTRVRIAVGHGLARELGSPRGRARAASRACHARIPGSRVRAQRGGDCPKCPASAASPKRGCAAPRRRSSRRRSARAAFASRTRRRRCSSSSAMAARCGGSMRPGRARLDTLMPRLLGLIADVPRGTASGVFAGRCPAARAAGARGDRLALGVFRAAQRKSRRCAASSWTSRRSENSSRRRSPRIRCCSTSCSTIGAGGLPPARDELEAEVASRLAHLAEEEPERQVEVLRQFQRAAIFRVAMADLTGRIPLMRVSDYLTEIAEIIVEQAMQLAWRQMTAQFGVPHYRDQWRRATAHGTS